MRLIFIRHAEPDYSIDSLTEKGWPGSEALAERTKRWKVDEFYCSPLGRAEGYGFVYTEGMWQGGSDM